MAVNVTKSGGIYIEISGDYTQLQQDLRAVNDLAKVAGADISKSLEGAIDPKRAASSLSSLTQTLMKAQAAGKTLSADFSSQEKALREWGQAVGIAGKELDNYVALQTKALKNQSAKDFVFELRTLQRVTGASDDEMNRLAKSLGGMGTEFTRASRSTRDLCINMTQLYLEGAKVAALKAVWDAFKGSFELAARYETLGVVVQQVGKVSGYSAVEVDKNVNALRRMGIAGVEARKTMTQLIQAQVDITKTPGLARIAQDAAVIGGIDSSQAFEKMVHGIQSAQTEVLRTIGINVNFEQSYRKLAAQLGKTTEELTEQEKVQARANAVMESGKNITGTYEAAMTTLGKQMGSLTRVQQDFLTDFGKFSLEVAQASGGIKGYTTILQGLSAVILALRGNMAGLSLDEILMVSRGKGLQSMRELVEEMEAAREETEKFEAQLASLAGKITAADSSFLQGQLVELKARFDAGELSANSFRRSIIELMAVAQAQVTQSAVDAPASMFTFKGQAKEIEAEAARIDAAYAKTAERTKQMKVSAVNEQREMVKALAAAGKYTAEEAAKMDKAFAKEIETLTKGSRSASLATERTSYQAAEAARAAADSLKNLQLRHSELVAQLDGNSLGAALARSQRDYETQIDAIAKKEAEIAKNRALWAKEGKLSGEAKSSLDEQQRDLDQEKALLEQIKKTNEQLALRAEATRQHSIARDYAGLLGNVQAVYEAEVGLLNIDWQRIEASRKNTLAALEQVATLEKRQELELSLAGILSEQALVQERIRIAEARANGDAAGMFQTGMNKMAQDAGQRMIDFWEKTIPESIGAVSDTFGTLFADIATGTKSASDAFADMGKTFQNISHQIISEIINMTVRMAIFKGVSTLGSFFGGGSTMALGSMTPTGTVSPSFHAKGGVRSSPSLSAYSNTIVNTPTVFPFAKGIGLMGEAGAEAIMPLTRTSMGDLGVKVDLGGGGGGNVVYQQTFHNEFHIDGTSNDGEDISQEISQKLMSQMERSMAAFVDRRIMAQTRPGGMLNQGIR